jgi:hypothetical protein
MKTVRIGNGCGFWGDSVDAPLRLVQTGRLDYLTLEYLAELTMSILALLRQRDPAAGYAHDFLDVLSRLAPEMAKQPKLKVITNAGGMNPLSCGRKAREILKDKGRVGVVAGDDLLPRLDELLATGHALKHLDTGEPLESIRGRVVSANAYLGAKPIAEALARGASIVITGRVADASLTVGPCVHEFGWSFGDIDRLAAATVAGHLIECGAQMTGGLWMNADVGTNLSEVGYPIAEVASDGSMIVTKPAGTGGTVNVETVSEQLLYEVADPARYLTPDVVADFKSVTLKEIRKDEVNVTGSRGTAATDSYKVSVAYRDGFTAAGLLTILGPNAAGKARQSGEIIMAKLKQAGIAFEHSHIEVLGAGSVVPGVITPKSEPVETILRLAVRDPNKTAVERFTKEFAPLVTSGFPGTTGYTTGRPQVREVFAYWPALIAKNAVTPTVEILE